MLITVFTPTYNRAYTIERVFDSLMAQTFSHDKFEWILIDDGSSDNTQELVDSFLKKADFKIVSITQQNMGKNYCHNRAITLAEGELFLILDSDDAIVPECMDTFWKHWLSLDQNVKKNIYGINCLCKDGYTDKLIGHSVQEGFISDSYKWKHKHRVFFETWGALNTQLFKQHLFPQIDEIKFIPEAYLWDRVRNKRAVLSTNNTLRIVFHQKDGFTCNTLKSYISHSKGRYLYHQMIVNELFFELLKYNPLRLLKDIIQLGRMGFHSNYSYFRILKEINSFFKKIIFMLFTPISFYFYKNDRKNT